MARDRCDRYMGTAFTPDCTNRRARETMADPLVKLDTNVPFVSAVFEGTVTGDFNAAAAILQLIEVRHKVMFTTLLPMDEGVFWSNRWVQDRIHPFLRETQLVCTAGDLLSYAAIFDRVGRRLSASWQAWGKVLADWANASWFAKPSGDADSQGTLEWGYMDFYTESYIEYLVEGYATWSKGIRDTIARKDEMFGAHLCPSRGWVTPC